MKVEKSQAESGDASLVKRKRRKPKPLAEGEVKKKQNPSCDACRARKVRCERDPPLDDSFNVYAPGAIIPSCKHCSGLNIVCSYNYTPRKRGPPNLYLKRLKNEGGEASASGTSSFQGYPPSMPHPPGQPPGSASEGSNSSTSPANAGDSSSSGLHPSFGGYPDQQQYALQHLQQQQHPSSYPAYDRDDQDAIMDEQLVQVRPPTQIPYPNLQPPPSQQHMYGGPSGDGSSSAHLNQSFGSLTLPPVTPSPPITPGGLASTSISSYPRYDLSAYPPSLAAHLSGPPRAGLPSILRTSPLTSPLATNNFPLQHSSQPPYGASSAYPIQAQHAPSPPYLSGPGPMSYERGSGPWAGSDPVAAAVEARRMSAEAMIGQGGPSPTTFIQQAPSPIGLSPQSAASSSLTRVNRVEDVLNRDTAVFCVSLFFDYVWPLTPCLHQPTFLADLASRKEERDPLFFALLMSTLACTLVQVPKSYIPVESGEVRKLAARCFRASRAISHESYDPPMVDMVIIRYFDTVYHYVVGNVGSNHATYGDCQQLAISLGLHREETYAGLDPIETEIRRRIFWLLVIADKSMMALSGRPVALRPEDYHDVALPKELDDEFITREVYALMPSDRTSIIVGFNMIIRIFSLLGEIITVQRETRRVPPVGPEGIVKKLREVGGLMSRTINLLHDSPPAFQIRKTFNSAANSPAAGWDVEAKSQIHSFFFDPNSSKKTAKDAFLVSQANVFITHALTRFMLLQYRDELLDLAGPPGTPMRTAAERVSIDSEGSGDKRERVAVDLLNVLHNIPIPSLAVNGPALVRKVRFVASTLLDLDPEPATAENGGQTGGMRINSYLWDFLQILSDIEKNFAD